MFAQRGNYTHGTWYYSCHVYILHVFSQFVVCLCSSHIARILCHVKAYVLFFMMCCSLWWLKLSSSQILHVDSWLINRVILYDVAQLTLICFLFTLLVFGVNITPTINLVIVKNIYIFNNTNDNIFFRLLLIYTLMLCFGNEVLLYLFTTEFLNYTISFIVKYYVFMKKSMIIQI